MNTFSTQRQHRQTNSRAMHLQQRWQRLMEREQRARRSNRELLQQFDRAQDVLTELLVQNAAMKTIRMEYERYLEKRAPYWQQQFQQKAEAAQRRRMEDYLKTYLRETEEQLTKSTTDPPLLSQGLAKKTQRVPAPRGESDARTGRSYDAPDLPHLPPPWLFRPQSRTSLTHQPSPQDVPSHPPPPPSPLDDLHRFASALGLPHLWPKQEPADWTADAPGPPLRPEAPRGHQCMEEVPHERGGGVEAGRGHSSHGLDMNPVRLDSGRTESGQSSRASSSSFSTEKKKKKMEKQSSVSSDRGSSSSENLFGTFGKRSEGVAAGSMPVERSASERLEMEGCVSEEESSSADRGGESGRPSDGTESSEDENGDSEEGTRTKRDEGEETRTERDEEEERGRVGDEDELPASSGSQGEEEDDRGEDWKPGPGFSQEEEEEEEEDDRGEDGKPGPGFSQDEGESEKHEEEEEEGEDSDDSIITPHVNRSGVIPEEAAPVEEEEDCEDEEEESPAASSESSEEDIENLLAPQQQTNRVSKITSDEEEDGEDEEEESPAAESSEEEEENLLAPQQQTNKQEKDLNVNDTPKASLDYVEVFQVEQDSPMKVVSQSDDDEFDHFYD